MVTGTPCHSSMPYARRSLVYSHFVTINRIMTVGFWKSQRIKSSQFYFIHDTYLDYIVDCRLWRVDAFLTALSKGQI